MKGRPSFFLDEIKKLDTIGDHFVLRDSGLTPVQVRNSISRFRKSKANTEGKVYSSRTLTNGVYVITLVKKGVSECQ